MAKKKETTENLFDNNSFTSFEVEGEEKKTDSIEESNNGFEIEVTNKQESNMVAITEQVTSLDKKDSIESFIILSQPLVEKAFKTFEYKR